MDDHDIPRAGSGGRSDRQTNRRRSPRAGLGVLASADVLIMVDYMAVTVALPSIQSDLGFSPASLQWVLTAYALALGSFLLVGGRTADLFGRRRLLMAGLVVFVAGSLLAGLAPLAVLLLIARAVQGLGAALAVPAALALLAAVFRDERQRRRALGLLSAAIFVGMVAGLVVGGVITALVGWPWVFFVVVPFALAAAALAPSILPESRAANAPGRLDLLGAALAAGGFALLVYAVTQAEHRGPGSPITLGALGVALGLLVAFVIVERRVPHPVLRLGILRYRSLRGANLAIAANAGGFSGLIFLSTLYLQQVLGFSPLLTGVAFLPLAVSATAGGLVAPRLVDRLGPRRVAIASLLLTAAIFAVLFWLPAERGYLLMLLPVFFVIGLSFTAAYVPLTNAGVSGVPHGETGRASGLYQTSTHLGGAITVAALAVVAAAATEARAEMAPEAALTAGFQLAFLVAAGLATLGALSAGLLLRAE